MTGPLTTDQQLIIDVDQLQEDLDVLTARVTALEAGGGSGSLGDIYDTPTGSTVVNAFALQTICTDGEILGNACLQHPDGAVRTAAGEMLSMLEACGYPK